MVTNKKTATALRNVERDQWTSTYDRQFTGNFVSSFVIPHQFTGRGYWNLPWLSVSVPVRVSMRLYGAIPTTEPSGWIFS